METKRLYRNDTDRLLGGVCAGLAAYLKADALIVRVLFVALALINGVGLIAYLLLWILVPEAGTEYADQNEMIKRNTQEIGQRLQSLVRQAGSALSGRGIDPWQGRTKSQTLLIGVAILGLGILILLNNVGALPWLRLGTFWPLLLIAAGAAMLLKTLRNRR